jgi:hypothetical protein
MPKIHRLWITVANIDDIYKLFESRISAFMAENGILFTQILNRFETPLRPPLRQYRGMRNSEAAVLRAL